MWNIPEIINEATPIRNFHLIFLSEGFTSADEQSFLKFCKGATDELFKIEPFNFAKPRFDVRAFFSASNTQGISNASQDTEYKFFLAPDGSLLTSDPGKITDKVRSLIFSINNENQYGEGIWLDPQTKGSRLICIVIKRPEQNANLLYNYWTDPAQPRDPALEAMMPVLAMTTWPTEQNSTLVYKNPFAASAAVLARELGRYFGLAYENEGAGAGFENYGLNDEISAPNITSLAALQGTLGDDSSFGSPTVNIDMVKQNLKWYDLISTKRNKILKEFSHPTFPDNAKAAEYSQIAASAENAIVLLHHQKLAANPNDTSTLIDKRYFESPRKALLSMKSPNLIEGGASYRTGVFRSSPECLMRFPGYEAGIGTPGETFKTVPFCKVCSKHILAHLGSLYNFKPDGVRILPQFFYPPKQMLRSDLADAFVRYIQLTETSINWVPLYCIAASFRRFEGFFRKALRWEAFHMGDVKAAREEKDTDQDYEKKCEKEKMKWGGNVTLCYPRLQNDEAWDAHVLWTSSLKEQKKMFARNPTRYMPYLGAGAAGAVAFCGFGKIVNEGEYVTELYKGRQVTYYRYKNLEETDFANISPGSLIQFWYSDFSYNYIMRFIAGINEDDVDEVIGHSAVLMDSTYVADQRGIYSEKRIANWKFRIVAQLYDAENIPPEEKWNLNLL